MYLDRLPSEDLQSELNSIYKFLQSVEQRPKKVELSSAILKRIELRRNKLVDAIETLKLLHL